MIVADTSVWIDFFRGTASPECAQLIESINTQTVLVGDLVLCEVLRGIPTEAEARDIERILRGYVTAAMCDVGIAALAAANSRRLRRAGITIRSTIDLLIGTFCIVNGHALLHRDRDFDVMAQHLGLRVVRA